MRKTQDLNAVKGWVLACLVVVLQAIPSGHAAPSGVVSSQPDLINWIKGPAVADIGSTAQIQVPPGFQFATAADAAIVLRQGGNAAPATLVGMLAPVGLPYIVVFEYNPIGYVKTQDREKVDAEAALLTLQESAKQQKSRATLSWAKEPVFDSVSRSVEWALAVNVDNRRSVNQTVRLLGREGVLDAIAIHGNASPAGIPLKQLMAGVSFKPGYAYKDFRKGDVVALHALSDLAVSEPPAPRKAELSYLWPGVGIGSALVLGCGTWMVIRRRKRKPRSHGHHPVRILLNAAASRKLEYVYPHLNGQNGANGNGHNGANGQGKLRRRRVFDYQRFYSDLLFEVSDRSQVAPAIATRGRLTTPDAPENKQPDLPMDPAVANLNLIEHQKRLIDQQKQLIEEQAKLIEEKTRLIHEKNQVLDKQAELFGNVF